MKFNDVQHVFLVGAKSLGAYGGYETFVNKLTEYHQNNGRIQYHVACKANGDGCMDETKVEGVSDIIQKDGKTVEFTYHNARCFKIYVPQKLGPAQAIYYDVKALNECCRYIERNNIQKPIVYIMACRIGPFMRYQYSQIHKHGGKIYINPDGHEWKRAKWPAPVRKYWKVSEQMMVKWCDLVVCDSINIEKYIHEQYDGKGIRKANPQTTYISYGAETKPSSLSDQDPKVTDWYTSKNVRPKQYYLVVGRFVPENNYETMIKEFMNSATDKDFVIITNVNDKFLNELEERLHFKKDPRIKFVGTVYDQDLLTKIRENAYGYFHGHEVGGTNPSLLESLGATDLNLLLNVGFNKEVALDSAIYWSKDSGSLTSLINEADQINPEKIAALGQKAKKRVKDAYSWEFIAGQYEDVFLDSFADSKVPAGQLVKRAKLA
jgi:rhamnosyltransferase